MSDGTDWDSVMFHLHQDRHLMQVHEAFVDLISGRAARYNALDPFNSGFFGHDDFGSVYVEDDDTTDDDSDYEDHNDKKEFCGFPRNFLDHAPPRSRSPHPPHPPCRTGLRQIMHEQAEKNAKELVEEEERLKVKAEKKRLKKLRRKERKRKEKEKEQENSDTNKDGDNREVENCVVKSKFSNSESVYEKSDKAAACIPAEAAPAAPLKTTQAGATSVQNKPNSNASSEDEDEEEYEEEEDSDVESIASELEVLDMNSCFVSKAATIAKRKLELKAKPEKREEKRRLEQRRQQQQSGQRGVEPCQRGVEPRPRGVEPQPQQKPQPQQQNAQVASIEDVVKRSTELAVIGNQLGNSGRFDMAVIYFTDAIKHNPKDFRLFGNRSFCYEKMQQYEKALIDADISLAMSPGWIRGLYRRGRALAGLKRYSDAAVAFKNVLQQDSTLPDAAQELMRVQIMQLMEMGFSREQSSNALIIHGTVEKALEAFSNIHDEKFGSSSPPVANASQPVEEGWVVAGQKSQPPANQATAVPTQPISHPRPQPPSKANPVKDATPELFPVWVGNLVPSITGIMVHKLFSTVGPIHNVKMLPSARCAFVNYTRKGDCDTAIREFHGMGLEGAVMCVRYPDRIHPHLGASRSAKQATELIPKVVSKSVPTLPGECVFWRNSGCIKKERCTFKHIPSHKGVDRGKQSP